MTPGKTMVLLLTANGVTQETTVNADGSFQFPEPVVGEYTIAVKAAPTGQACTVATGGAITVSCAAVSSSFKLGGTVSGNTGVVAFRNAANGDTLVLNTNGAFTFAQPVLQGGNYSVSVFDQSAGQTCGVTNGNGTASTDVTNIQVSCAAIVAVAPPIPVPAVPTGLTMTYGIKRFNLAWGTVTAPVNGGAVTYRVFEDPDGAGPLASAQISGSLAGASYTHSVSGLLHTRLNARYSVQACNSGGCSTPTAAITPNLTQAIGYFKASNTGSGDTFGYAVALSGDGNTLAVGAVGEGSNAIGINGDGSDNSAPVSGAVYIYIRSAGTWSQQAYVKASNSAAGDAFGDSVALSADGSTLAVGAIGQGGDGAVYVFTRSAGNWNQQAYVKASNVTSTFGNSVALSADGGTMAVGAWHEGDQAGPTTIFSGAAYVFTRTAGVWTQQAYLKASNTGAFDQFGSSVALSNDGNTLAVGAFGERSNATGINGDQTNNSTPQAGAVYVFTRSAGTWSQQAYVKASRSGPKHFGGSVALSADGNTLAVGAYGEGSNATGVNGDQTDTSAPDAGAVYVFTRSGATWSQQAYVKASNTEGGDQFGISVALSADGNTLAVGAWIEAGSVAGIGGDQSDNSAIQAGAMYVFTRSGATWNQRAYVKASNPESGDGFGYRTVALSADGNTLAVGAFHEAGSATGINGNQADNSGFNTGAVYLY
ncbi:MAG: integrin [Haliea sp.]|nr:MAG: integrin [Haliea sp.]